jgi:hypothetical protein
MKTVLNVRFWRKADVRTSDNHGLSLQVFLDDGWGLLPILARQLQVRF